MDGIQSVYGSHGISSGIFEWRLKLIKISSGGVCVGIIQEDILVDYLQNFNYDSNGHGAFWYNRNGKFYDRRCKISKITDTYEQPSNTVIGVKIDFNDKSLSYSIDGKEYKKTSHSLNINKVFRFVVTFNIRCDGTQDEIELL